VPQAFNYRVSPRPADRRTWRPLPATHHRRRIANLKSTAASKGEITRCFVDLHGRDYQYFLTRVDSESRAARVGV
jgi:hypothetical protein